jgi:dihydrofolate synthase/folylpolyglutamate synthase
MPRALKHEELKNIAAENKLQGNSYDNVNKAITEAKKNAADDDVIMICGSFFIIAEMEDSYFSPGN